MAHRIEALFEKALLLHGGPLLVEITLVTGTANGLGRASAAEFIGTFALIFIGAGASLVSALLLPGAGFGAAERGLGTGSIWQLYLS